MKNLLTLLSEKFTPVTPTKVISHYLKELFEIWLLLCFFWKFLMWA